MRAKHVKRSRHKREPTFITSPDPVGGLADLYPDLYCDLPDDLRRELPSDVLRAQRPNKLQQSNER